MLMPDELRPVYGRVPQGTTATLDQTISELTRQGGRRIQQFPEVRPLTVFRDSSAPLVFLFYIQKLVEAAVRSFELLHSFRVYFTPLLRQHSRSQL